MAWLDGLLFLLGVALLVGGAEALVRGAAGLASRHGVSPLVVGLTIVAMGTSLPEVVVSVLASARGAGELAVANAVGSNILNVLVVLGTTALIAPMAIHRTAVRRDIPLVSAVGLLVLLLSLKGSLGRLDGALLLLGLVVYIVYAVRKERRTLAPEPSPPGAVKNRVLVLYTLLGAAFLAGGAHLVVQSATGIAQALGVSERIIGLTLIAVGTSLPELATSIVASLRRQVDIAVGNIVGSNLVNLLLALGAAALVRPLPISRGALLTDLPMMLAASLILLPLARTGFRLHRLEGALLLLLYAAFVSLLLVGALPQ